MIREISILLLFVVIAHGTKLHEFMLPEEVEAVFKCKHHEVDQLKYDIITLIHTDSKPVRNRLRAKISKPTVHLEAFGKTHKLYLEETNHSLLGRNTPVYLAELATEGEARINDEENIRYNRIQYPLPKNFKMYHDRKKRAALTAYIDEENRSHFHGIIGDEIIIRPLPERVRRDVLSQYPEILNGLLFNPVSENLSDTKLPYYEATHHIAIKRDLETKSAPSLKYNRNHLNVIYSNDEKEDNDQFNDTFNHKSPSIIKRSIWDRLFGSPTTKKSVTSRPTVSKIPATQAPINTPSDTIYPEILIAVDYETVIAHNGSTNDIAMYMAAFWNAVDLRYRELNDPKVRLNIAGLIIPKTKDAVPYFNRHEYGINGLLVEETLEELGNYFQRQTKIPRNSFDIAVGITHRNLGDLEKGKFIDGTTGIAFLEGACKTRLGSGVALTKDLSSFNGITTAAHELGHAMGAPHDGKESSIILGGPCSSDDGYLMSYNRRDINGIHWSQCSKTAMRNFMKSNDGACLKNLPSVGEAYPKILPGKIESRDEQCNRTMGLTAYEPKIDDCTLLWCVEYERKGNIVYMKGTSEGKPPAEGTSCGNGGFCLNGICVRDPEGN